MAKFIGIYKGKLDDKGRLVFPSAFKGLMGNEPLQFVVKKDLFEECLAIYTYSEWEKESEELKSKLNFFNKEHNMFWREYMKDRATIEPDEKFGRINIPLSLLESIKVKKDVLFCGNDHKIELWAKEVYDSKQMEDAEFLSLAEKIGLL
jgi:MraZ protein